MEKLKDTGLNGRMLEKAQLMFNQTTNEPVVSLTFNSEGRQLFAKITKENVGNILGIFLDGPAYFTPSGSRRNSRWKGSDLRSI
jgi:preprotein translocase subunit SecD